MGNLHDLVEQACNYGLVGGERYSCLKAVQVPDLRKAFLADMTGRVDAEPESLSVELQGNYVPIY